MGTLKLACNTEAVNEPARTTVPQDAHFFLLGTPSSSGLLSAKLLPSDFFPQTSLSIRTFFSPETPSFFRTSLFFQGSFSLLDFPPH